MGFVFAYFSVIANTVKGYCSKKISTNVNSAYGCIMFNIIRMLFCCVIAFLYAFMTCKTDILAVGLLELAICFISGAGLAIFAVSWTLAIKSDAYMFVTSVSCSSFLVPMLFGLTLFGELFTAFKAIAVILIVASMFFMVKYNISFTHKMTLKDIAFLFLLFLSQGLNQASQKMYTFYSPKSDVAVYTLYSFIFTVIVLLLWSLVFKAEKRTGFKELHLKSNLKYIIMMSIGIFAVNYFQTLAAKQIDAIVLYPLTSALSLVSGSIMASVIFKEKLKKDCIIGISFVFMALVLSKV